MKKEGFGTFADDSFLAYRPEGAPKNGGERVCQVPSPRPLIYYYIMLVYVEPL